MSRFASARRGHRCRASPGLIVGRADDGQPRMPGGRARRHHRPARRLDLSHHLVARAPAQSAREQRRASRRGWSISTPIPSSSSPRASDGEPRLFLDADGVLADFDAALEAARMPPRSKQAWPRRVLEAARQGAELLRRLPECPTPTAVRCRQAFEADDPHRAADRQLGGAAKGASGRPSISRASRSSPAWPATSTSTCIRATCWSTTARTTARL